MPSEETVCDFVPLLLGVLFLKHTAVVVLYDQTLVEDFAPWAPCFRNLESHQSLQRSDLSL